MSKQKIIHPSTGIDSMDGLLDLLAPEGHAACLACTLLPWIDGQLGNRLLASLRSRVRLSRDRLQGPARETLTYVASLSTADRAEARRKAVQQALKKAHTEPKPKTTEKAHG